MGGRLENYDVKATLDGTKIYSDNYTTLYPSAFFTFNPSEKNQYQLSYSRRVDRPGLSQVNPIREWSTPQITSVGTPNYVLNLQIHLKPIIHVPLKKGRLLLVLFTDAFMIT